jgi:hypothetical protein
MAVQINVQEYHLSHMLFRQIGQMSNYEIEQMGVKYPEARRTDKGIPVFGMIFALNEERKKLTEVCGSNISQDMGSAKLEHELKNEMILSKRILNQAKLGILIPKEEASDRVKRILTTVMNMLKNNIKMVSPQLVNIVNLRDIESIITNEWNKAVEILEKESKIITWGEDGSSKLLQTRLNEIEMEDPDFAEIVKNRKAGNTDIDGILEVDNEKEYSED